MLFVKFGIVMGILSFLRGFEEGQIEKRQGQDISVVEERSEAVQVVARETAA
jgi:hypothetical protein